MTTERDFRKLSRMRWNVTDGVTPGSFEHLKLGAALRIADALEKLADSNGRDYWRDRATDAEAELATERRRTAQLRAALKKAKGKT